MICKYLKADYLKISYEIKALLAILIFQIKIPGPVMQPQNYTLLMLTRANRDYAT